MILVTGAGGMVGSYVKEVFGENDVFLTDMHAMDVTDYSQVEGKVKETKPDIILHLAAKTDVDKCEIDIDETFRVNVLGVQNVALVSQKFDILMVYLSTAGVFGGEKLEPYTEFDKPNPVNIYGKAKLEGERIVQDLLNKYFIIRAGWMIGGGEKDKKFVAKIVKLCREKEEIMAVNDKFGTPTYAKHLLQTIKELIKTSFYGLYHIGNKGMCSRYDVAMEIAKFLGNKTKIVPVNSDFFPLPAPRTRSEAIRNYKLDIIGLDNMPTWQEALQEYLSKWLGNVS